MTIKELIGHLQDCSDPHGQVKVLYFDQENQQFEADVESPLTDDGKDAYLSLSWPPRPLQQPDTSLSELEVMKHMAAKQRPDRPLGRDMDVCPKCNGWNVPGHHC